MTLRQKLAALKARGIDLNHAESAGGGNRDHRVWFVEFTGSCGFRRVHVECRTNTGSFDGKRACEREAKELAADIVLADTQ